MLQWIEAVETGDAARIAEVRQRLVSQMRRATPTPGVGTPAATPVGATPRSTAVGHHAAGAGTPFDDVGAGGDTPMRAGSEAGTVAGAGASGSVGEGGGEGEAGSLRMRLDAFLSQYTSEDDASFKKNMKKREKEIKKQRWWAYESASDPKVYAKHLALTAGAEPKLIKDVCASPGFPPACPLPASRVLCPRPSRRGARAHRDALCCSVDHCVGLHSGQRC